MILKKFQGIFGKALQIIREYPMILAMALISAISLICTIDYDRDPAFVFTKVALVAALGIPVMFALKMLSQRIGRGILLELSGVLFLIIFYFLLPEYEREFTEQYAFLILPTFILSHLLVAFIAFLKKEREYNFWQYNKNLFINIFLTGVFTGVLTGGVLLAILAVDHLFDFNFNSDYYLYNFYFLSIFGSCFIFLLFNDKGLPQLETEGDYPVVLKFFTQYILIPLLLIYAIILYFYSAKILINWELPRGWVSYLILAYSILGILAILLVHPLKEDSTKSWVKAFTKIFYYTLIPLIILLFVAIFTRILEYGYTEPRYFVLLLSVWLTAVMLYFILIRKNTIKFIPVSLFAFGLFSLVFPYLNTFSVAKRSQKAELMKTLSQNNLIKNGTINFNKKVAHSLAYDVSDKFEFLAKRNEEDFLKNLLNQENQEIIAKNIANQTLWNVSNDMKTNFMILPETAQKSVEMPLELVSKNKIYAIGTYDYMFAISDLRGDALVLNNDKFEILSLDHRSNALLIIKVNGLEWNLSPAIEEMLNKFDKRQGRIEISELSMEKDLGNYHLKVIFGNLVKENSSLGGIYYQNAYIFIRIK